MRITRDQWIAVAIAVVLTAAVGFFSQARGASVGKDATFNGYVRDIIRTGKDAKTASGFEVFNDAPWQTAISITCTSSTLCAQATPIGGCPSGQIAKTPCDMPATIGGSVKFDSLVRRDNKWYAKYTGTNNSGFGKHPIDAYWNPETKSFINGYSRTYYSCGCESSGLGAN